MHIEDYVTAINSNYIYHMHIQICRVMVLYVYILYDCTCTYRL